MLTQIMPEITQVEAPEMQMLSHTFQVGAPGNPNGISLNFEIKWVHNKWTISPPTQWTCECGRGHEHPSEFAREVVETEKKYNLGITDTQIESLLDEWKSGVVDYEEWLLDLKTKKQVYDFNYEKSRKSWVRKLFRRPVHSTL